MRAAGIAVVVNLRGPGEDGQLDDERAVVERLAMRYEVIPIASVMDLTGDNARRLASLLAQTRDDKVLLHCRSGNRVGALMALIADSRGATTDEALDVGRAHGLTKLEPVVKELLEKRGSSGSASSAAP